MKSLSAFPAIFEDKLPDLPEEERDKISRSLSEARMRQLTGKPVKGNYDIEHLSNIHKHLFQDVSTHAGSIRDYGMSKGSSQFADSSQMAYLFDKELPERINALNQSLNDRQAYIDAMTDLHSTLDLAHPFREGNGRAARAFMSQLAETHGYQLDFSQVNREQWVKASIDSIDSGGETLKRPLFEPIVVPIRERQQAQHQEQRDERPDKPLIDNGAMDMTEALRRDLIYVHRSADADSLDINNIAMTHKLVILDSSYSSNDQKLMGWQANVDGKLLWKSGQSMEYNTMDIRPLTAIEKKSLQVLITARAKNRQQRSVSQKSQYNRYRGR